MYYEDRFTKKFLGEADLSEPYYSFDLIGLWKDDAGYYLGTDSGCSCPSPWENHTDDDLTGPLTAEQAREEATNLKGNDRYDRAGFEAFLNLIE